MISGHLSYARIIRRAEWVGVGIALFLMSGAIFPLLLEGPGGLTEAARSKLRVLSMPGMLIGMILIMTRPISAAKAALGSLPMFGLLLLPVLSVLWSIGPSITLRRAIALVLAMAIAYALATRFTMREQLMIYAGLLGGTTVLSLLAMGLMPGKAFMPGEAALRGVFSHKNALGWIASFTFIVGLVARLQASPAIRRMGVWLLLIGVSAVLLSTSATSLIASVVAVGTLLAVRTISRREGVARLLIVLCTIVLSVLIITLLFFGIVPLLETLGKDATLTGRVPLWHEVDHQIARRPWQGFGYGAFWYEGNPAAWTIWGSQGWQAPHAHNGYRDLLLQTGVIGLGLFILATIQALAQGIILCTRLPDEGWELPILFIVASLVLNLTETTFLKQGDLFWILYAASAVSISYRHALMNRGVPRQIRLAIAAT